MFLLTKFLTLAIALCFVNFGEAFVGLDFYTSSTCKTVEVQGTQNNNTCTGGLVYDATSSTLINQNTIFTCASVAETSPWTLTVLVSMIFVTYYNLTCFYISFLFKIF